MAPPAVSPQRAPERPHIRITAAVCWPELLFGALPAVAVNEVVIQRSVFIRMLQVQSAGFDSILNVQEEQSLIEGDAELAVPVDCCLFLWVQESGRGGSIDPAIFVFE